MVCLINQTPELIMTSVSLYFNKETHIAICEELMNGSSDLDIQNKLVSSGVPQEHTLPLIEHVRMLTDQAKNMAVSPVPTNMPSFIPGPEGSFAVPLQANAFPTFIDVEGQIVRVAMRLRHPEIIIFEDVLTEAECDELVKMAEPQIQRSMVVNNDEGGSKVANDRTSNGTYFHKGFNALIETLDKRCAALTGWPIEKTENVQVLRYMPGEEYKPHNDYFDTNTEGGAAHVGGSGNRIGTLLIYLSDVYEGGSTFFPESDLHVMPKKGSAVYFGYPQSNSSSKTMHAGSPVKTGIKWVATKWLRQNNF